MSHFRKNPMSHWLAHHRGAGGCSSDYDCWSHTLQLAAFLVECGSECMWTGKRVHTNEQVLHTSPQKGLAHTKRDLLLQFLLLELIQMNIVGTQKEEICGIFTQPNKI